MNPSAPLKPNYEAALARFQTSTTTYPRREQVFQQLWSEGMSVYDIAREHQCLVAEVTRALPRDWFRKELSAA